MSETPQTDAWFAMSAAKQERMLRARNDRKMATGARFRFSAWWAGRSWLPTLIGVALGVWIDHRWPSRFSWAVTLLIAGTGRWAA